MTICFGTHVVSLFLSALQSTEMKWRKFCPHWSRSLRTSGHFWTLHELTLTCNYPSILLPVNIRSIIAFSDHKIERIISVLLVSGTSVVWLLGSLLVWRQVTVLTRQGNGLITQVAGLIRQVLLDHTGFFARNREVAGLVRQVAGLIAQGVGLNIRVSLYNVSSAVAESRKNLAYNCSH